MRYVIRKRVAGITWTFLRISARGTVIWGQEAHAEDWTTFSSEKEAAGAMARIEDVSGFGGNFIEEAE